MNNLVERAKKMYQRIIPANEQVGWASMIISTVVALLVSGLIYNGFKESLQPYHDIVAGDLSLPGVNKAVDFYAFYSFIGVYFLSFIMISMLANKSNIGNEMKIRQFSKGTIFTGIFIPFVIMLYRYGNLPMFHAIYGVIVIVSTLIFLSTGFEKKVVVKLVISSYYIYLTLSGLLALVTLAMPSIVDRISQFFIIIFGACLIIWGWILSKLESHRMSDAQSVADKFVQWTQMLIPLILLGLINIRYIYQGAYVEINSLERFNFIIVSIVGLLIASNLISVMYQREKANISSVNITTIVSIACISFWNSGYNMLINLDPFHTGETEIIWTQVVELGQHWNTDFVSVLQGLGLFISGVNKILFGGTFATYELAHNFVMVMVAALLSVLLYLVIEHKWLLLFYVPVMPLFFMNRTYLIPLVLVFLLNKSLIRRPILWTYSYIFTCILHILYQPTYGGALALALFPVWIYILYNGWKRDGIFDTHDAKSKRRSILFASSVILIGILCIPMLLGVLKFLKSNGFETVTGNGVSMAQVFATPGVVLTGFQKVDFLIHLMVKFGFGLTNIVVLTYLFFVYVLKETNREKQVQGIMLTFSVIVSYILIMPASFTRVDAGLSRIGSMNLIYSGCFVLLLLYLYRDNFKNKQVLIISSGILFALSFYITYPPYIQIHERVSRVVEIPSDALHVSVAESGIPKLGDAYIGRRAYYDEVMVLKEVVDTLLEENQTYYDFTDKIIYFNYTEKKVPGLYAAGMTAANEILQNQVIENIERYDVPLVFINNPLRYIRVSESLRSYRIYRYFMERDYEFIRYKNVDFLVRSDVDLSPLAGNLDTVTFETSFGLFDNQINIDSIDKNQDINLATESIVYNNSIVNDNNVWRISGIDPFYVFDTSGQINISDVDFVEFTFDKELPSGVRGQLFVQTDQIGHNEVNSIKFDMNTDKVIVPVNTRPELQLNGALMNIRLDFDNINDGSDVSIKSVRLIDATEVGMQDISQQYSMLSSKMKKKRLNEAFVYPNLGSIALEWGKSYDLMRNRFAETDTNVTIDEGSNSENKSIVNIKCDSQISGFDGEFLKMDLSGIGNDKITLRLEVRGLDKENEAFSEMFLLDSSDSTILVPIASSPTCLQAKRIESITLSDIRNQANLVVNDIKFLKLIQ